MPEGELKAVSTESPEALRFDFKTSTYLETLPIDPDKIPLNEMGEGLASAFAVGKASWPEKEHYLQIFKQQDGSLRGILITQKKGALRDGSQSIIMGGENRIFHITELELLKLQELFKTT